MLPSSTLKRLLASRHVRTLRTGARRVPGRMSGIGNQPPGLAGDALFPVTSVISVTWRRSKGLDPEPLPPEPRHLPRVGGQGPQRRGLDQARLEGEEGYLKIHFAVDVKTGQVVSMDVSSENVSDGRRLKRLLRRAEGSVRVRRVLGDGAYDPKTNFNFLAGEGIRPVIRVAKNSVPRCNGSYARKKAVIEQQAFRSKAWSRITRVRVQVEGRGGLLVHQEGLRRARHSKEVREHGQGDDDEGVHLQQVHCSEVERSHCPSRGHLRPCIRATENYLHAS